jgi:hypothetical protein
MLVQGNCVQLIESILLMKRLTSVLLTCLVLGVVGLGCSAKHEPEGELLEKGFAEASGEVKTQVDAALAAIKAEKYEEAVDALAKLEGVEMSDEQKQAIADVLVDLQTILTDQGGSPELLEKTQELMMSFL